MAWESTKVLCQRLISSSRTKILVMSAADNCGGEMIYVETYDEKAFQADIVSYDV